MWGQNQFAELNRHNLTFCSWNFNVKGHILSTAGANQVGCASQIVGHQIVLLSCTCMHTHTCMSTVNNSARANLHFGGGIGGGGFEYTSVVRVYHLPGYTRWVHVKYIIYFILFLLKSISSYQMRVQGYINLNKYAYFITLNISQKYSKLDPYASF